jgi:quinol monooxygenase YgiN
MTEQGTFGLIGQLSAVPGQRDELIACLRGGSSGVPGKIAYLIALDRNDPDSIWITEIWRDEAAYSACLAMPQVQVAAASLQGLIASAGPRIETVPLSDL